MRISIPSTVPPLAAFAVLAIVYAVVVFGAGATAALCFFAGY